MTGRQGFVCGRRYGKSDQSMVKGLVEVVHSIKEVFYDIQGIDVDIVMTVVDAQSYFRR